jgi:hypothetical protein
VHRLVVRGDERRAPGGAALLAARVDEARAFAGDPVQIRGLMSDDAAR